jgi:hypothetical protein
VHGQSLYPRIRHALFSCTILIYWPSREVSGASFTTITSLKLIYLLVYILYTLYMLYMYSIAVLIFTIAGVTKIPNPY